MRKHRVHAATDYVGAHLGEFQAAFTWYAPSRGACSREIVIATLLALLLRGSPGRT